MVRSSARVTSDLGLRNDSISLSAFHVIFSSLPPVSSAVQARTWRRIYPGALVDQPGGLNKSASIMFGKKESKLHLVITLPSCLGSLPRNA